MSRGSAAIPSALLCACLIATGNGCAPDGEATGSRAPAEARTGAVAPDTPPGSPSEPATPEPPTLPDGAPVTPCEDAPQGMACVPGGILIRGHDGSDGCDQPEKRGAEGNFRPAGQVWLQTFYMDLTEVTYGAYKACEAAGDCRRVNPQYQDFDRPDQPMTGPSWFDAVAYCESLGKRLPTEAQWELAARGGDGEGFPWGDEPATCERAVIMDEQGRSCGVTKVGRSPGTGRPFVVASKPAGRNGLFDMAGNAEEWVADWYSASYEECGAACAGIDPRGPCDGESPCPGHGRRVVKGGSWYWPAACATAYNRRPWVPSNDPMHHFGFRCAASVDEARALGAAPEEPPTDDAPRVGGSAG